MTDVLRILARPSTAADRRRSRLISAAGYLAASIGALVVGATEQVLEGRCAIATLVELAASPNFVERVIRRQLLLVSLPAAVIGAMVGWAAFSLSDLSGGGSSGGSLGLLGLPAALLIAGAAGGLGALLASRAVRPAILDAALPEQLRAP